MKQTFDELRRASSQLAKALETTFEPLQDFSTPEEYQIQDSDLAPEPDTENPFEFLQSPTTLLISPNEVSYEHGTGAILARIFTGRRDILSVRAHSHYSKHLLTCSVLLDPDSMTPCEMLVEVLRALGPNEVTNIVVVPYFKEDVLLALLAKRLFQGSLQVWVMDDNSVFNHGIDQADMRELLQRADINYAISPQLQALYQSVFAQPMHLLPPLVTESAIAKGNPPLPPPPKKLKAALIGNIWDVEWFRLLNELCCAADIEVDWYVANDKPIWLAEAGVPADRLRLRHRGALPESELADAIRPYTCVLLPTAEDSDRSPLTSVARLSLPTKLTFVLASASVPVLVLGSPKTCVSLIVERLKIGKTVPYEAKAFKEALETLQKTETRNSFHTACRSVAWNFSVGGIFEWMNASASIGRPVDNRFNELFPRRTADGYSYVEHPKQREYVGDLGIAHSALTRLQDAGIRPDWVLDIGASSGIWSDMCADVYPEARYLLFEPLLNFYEAKWTQEKHPSFEFIPKAVGDYDGEITFQISEDLFGSSLLQVNDGRTYNTHTVDIIRLDSLFTDRSIEGPVLAKIDVQCAEHLVIEGARQALAWIEVIFIELSLDRLAPNAMTFREVCSLLDELGYDYWDEAGGYRHPDSGILIQKDCVFLKKGRLQRPTTL